MKTKKETRIQRRAVMAGPLRWVPVAILAAVAAVSGALAAGTESFEWRGAIPAGGVFEVKNVNGSVTIRQAGGPDAVVRATKSARRDDPSRVEVRVVETVDDDGRPRVTVCAIYPGSDNRCAPGDQGRLSSHRSDVVVDFEIGVPRGVRTEVGTVNGNVDAAGLDARVIAETVNGSIELATSGAAGASSVNGSIDVELGAEKWDGAMRFETVNGSIRLRMPRLRSAIVAIKTQNGSIDSDWALDVEGRWVGRRASGTIGDGGGTLEVETVNGDVVIAR